MAGGWAGVRESNFFILVSIFLFWPHIKTEISLNLPYFYFLFQHENDAWHVVEVSVCISARGSIPDIAIINYMQ